jgi:hypothetical protein
MSSLVIGPVVGTPAIVEPLIVNDGWFPDIDPAAIRKISRIPIERVIPERLREALLNAIITVGDDLDRWRVTHLAAGRAKLDQVDPRVIDGENRLVILYRRAIGATAKAELVERQRDIDSTTGGQRDVADLEPSIGELRRDAIHAVRTILGRNLTDIELI